jgi:hypothetical protein
MVEGFLPWQVTGQPQRPQQGEGSSEILQLTPLCVPLNKAGSGAWCVDFIHGNEWWFMNPLFVLEVVTAKLDLYTPAPEVLTHIDWDRHPVPRYGPHLT